MRPHTAGNTDGLRAELTGSVRIGLLALLLALLCTSSLPQRAVGGVFHSKESALRLAFGEVDSITTRQLVLGDHEAGRIEQIARCELPSRLVNVHQGHRDGVLVGTAFIETHRVRSLPETLLVVVGPDGRTDGVHLLAFHEPPEYQPTEAWLGQFEERPLTDELALRRGIAGIAGSTLTATAVTSCVRRALAVYEVCLSSPTTASMEADSTAGTR